jgi:tetratricopeptide (TPR) repeat protein
MDKTSLVTFLNNPQSLTLNDIMLLENATKRYPYFQLAYTLIAKGIHTKAPEIANDAIRKAAIYALSRNSLRKVIENEIDWLPIKQIENLTESKQIQIDPIEEEFKREKLEEDLIISIAKPQLRNIQDEQLAIIDKFIKSEPRIQPIKNQNGSDEIVDLSERSTTLKNPLYTESYAKILVKQGRLENAIEVYKHLIVKNPEKMTYFAEKIEELQKKIL